MKQLSYTIRASVVTLMVCGLWNITAEAAKPTSELGKVATSDQATSALNEFRLRPRRLRALKPVFSVEFDINSPDAQKHLQAYNKQFGTNLSLTDAQIAINMSNDELLAKYKQKYGVQLTNGQLADYLLRAKQSKRKAQSVEPKIEVVDRRTKLQALYGKSQLEELKNRPARMQILKAQNPQADNKRLGALYGWKFTLVLDEGQVADALLLGQKSVLYEKSNPAIDWH